jgi:hypothetical protein
VYALAKIRVDRVAAEGFALATRNSLVRLVPTRFALAEFTLQDWRGARTIALRRGFNRDD